MNAPGTCTVTASQAGDATYAPAISVNRSVTAFIVNFSPAAVALSSPGVSTATVIVSSNPSGLPISVTGGASFFFAAGGNLSTPSLVTIFANPATTPGTYMGTATTTLGSIPVTLVVTPTLKPQSITFKPAPSYGVTGTSATVSATATSGLPVTYSAPLSSVCTVNSSTGVVSFLSTGHLYDRRKPGGRPKCLGGGATSMWRGKRISSAGDFDERPAPGNSRDSL